MSYELARTDMNWQGQMKAYLWIGIGKDRWKHTISCKSTYYLRTARTCCYFL